MDITKFKQKCPQHPDYKIEYLQVDNLIDNTKYQKLFYCCGCIDQDQNFKHQNFQLIKQIIQSGTDSILPKWPPVRDYKLLNQLIQITNEKVEIQSIASEIEKYFTDLKKGILQQLDFCQKRMIQQAQDLQQNKTQILSSYQQLSQINELKSILLNKDIDIHEKEKQYRVFLKNIQSQKKTITEQLAALLDKNRQTEFNCKSALQVKEQILNSISSINLFESPSESIYNNQKQQDVKLFTTNYQDGHKYTELSKNQSNEYQFIIKNNSFSAFNTVSSIILSNEAKYIFRIQIQMSNEYDFCYVGLIQDKNINSQHGSDDYLSCILQQKNQCINKYSSYSFGIDKLIKGNIFQLSKENEIEIRICLKDQIIEVLDYPNYMSKLALEDLYKSELINKKDLRLYLGMQKLNNSMILKEAIIVDRFE